VNCLSGRIPPTIREECKSGSDAKPIVKTYLEGSRTFPKNLSTEVLEKERREGGKVNGKVLIDTEKKEKRPKMEYQTQISTELRPGDFCDKYFAGS
jgi:hypothetical protein